MEQDGDKDENNLGSINYNINILYVRLLNDHRFIEYKDILLTLKLKSLKRDKCTDDDDDMLSIIEKINRDKKK